jgi:DNA polymerase-3 subunit gamma/tau
MLKKILASEGVEYDEKALETIAKYSGGSIRDAQSILEGFIRSGKVTAEKVKSIYQPIDPNTIHDYLNKVLTKDPQKCSKVFSNWMKLGITPDYVVSSLMEYLTDMLLEYTITDNTLKPLMKTQRDKIGDSRIASWLDFLYTQLRYIRDFPMTYTLLLNLITIKLMHEDEGKVSRKKEKAEKEEVKAEEAKTTPTAPTAPLRVSTHEIEGLKKLCGGTILEVDVNLQWITLKNKNGTVFDIVTTSAFAKSPLYILSSDLTTACTDYPNNMPTVIKSK